MQIVWGRSRLRETIHELNREAFERLKDELRRSGEQVLILIAPLAGLNRKRNMEILIGSWIACGMLGASSRPFCETGAA